VVVDLASKIGGETLLDDLNVLRDHNRQAEAQAMERYSLCERALDCLDGMDESWVRGLASVDAYCLYELLDDPPSVLPWVPIGDRPPTSPIAERSEDERYRMRVRLLEELLKRDGTIRPFAQVARLAFLTIEWIRWAELNGIRQGANRLLVYDVLFVARLLESAVCRAFLEADGDRLEAVSRALEGVDRSPALRSLVGKLGVDDRDPSRTRSLADRLPTAERWTLECLARGCFPDETPGGVQPLARSMLDHLIGVATTILSDKPPAGTAPSLFTLLARKIPNADDVDLIRRCLHAIDAACAGIHRGHAIGIPISLEYVRISGAAASPLATPDVDLDPVPKFKGIRVKGGGIDPDLKLSGNKLASFSAFITPRFRANDWMWGRMDAATELVDRILQPKYVQGVKVEGQLFALKQLMTGPFGSVCAPPESLTGSAEAVCAELWAQHEPAVHNELCEAKRSRDPKALELTRTLVKTRWHLEILVGEMPTVLGQPIEPGGSAIPPSSWHGSDPTDTPPKERLSRLIAAYEGSARRIGDLWGRRKTTALGVRVARQTARGLVPSDGFFAWARRTGIAAPLFLVVNAVLTRGAFLMAESALVGLVLLPRLGPVVRCTVALVTLGASFVFWLKVVRRTGRGIWKARASTLVSGLLLAAGVVGIWWTDWPVRSPNGFMASKPWNFFQAGPDTLRPVAIIAGASAFAVAWLWVWARRWAIVVAAVSVGMIMGWWAILSAWTRPDPPSELQRALKWFSSMWIPAVLLVVVFTTIAVHFHPEDRPRVRDRK
jgi:hypothetical protein